MLVIPDTNVLISGFAFPGGIPGKIVNAWRERDIEFALSEYILEEFERILGALPGVALSKNEISELCEILRFFSDIVIPITDVPEVRDPNDVLILGTLAAANADYLITGDKDLLALSDMLPIITPRAFWDRHGM